MLLEGIAQVLLSIDCMNEDFWEGSQSGIVRGVHIRRLANRDGSQ
jgi:hypothetical protein